MRLDKVIMSCDKPEDLQYWPRVAQVCKKAIKATPVLFKIGNTESDFHFDGHGLVKDVKRISDLESGLESRFYRMFGTHYFPEDVCLISDIDMLLLSDHYFQKMIMNFDDESMVVYASDADDPNAFGMCYHAARGKIFESVLNIQGKYEDFVKQLMGIAFENGTAWPRDSYYHAQIMEIQPDKYKLHKIKRSVKEGGIIGHRIEQWSYPVIEMDEQTKMNHRCHGPYDKSLLKSGYYIDARCPVPFERYAKEVEEVATLACHQHKGFETIPGQDFSMVNDRCLVTEGDIVDLGCLQWDWSRFFIGKKRVIGVDPFENAIPFTEIFKGVIGPYEGKTRMKNEGMSSTMIHSGEGEEVIVKTWKTFCREYSIQKIALLKINIEGMEYDLLDGFDDEDFDHIDQIAVSFHDWLVPDWISKTEKALKILDSMNYSIQKINYAWGWYLALKKSL